MSHTPQEIQEQVQGEFNTAVAHINSAVHMLRDLARDPVVHTELKDALHNLQHALISAVFAGAEDLTDKVQTQIDVMEEGAK